MNLYLVGFRGVGKSTVAPRLAARLQLPWIDLDAEAERRTGKSIRSVFRELGEPAFRDLESAILAEIATHEDRVVATGGGVVLSPANREILRRGFCVWLTADVDLLYERLRHDDDRPPLTDLPLRDEIAALLAARESHYRECAQLTLDAGLDIEELVERIVEAFPPGAMFPKAKN